MTDGEPEDPEVEEVGHDRPEADGAPAAADHEEAADCRGDRRERRRGIGRRLRGRARAGAGSSSTSGPPTSSGSRRSTSTTSAASTVTGSWCARTRRTPRSRPIIDVLDTIDRARDHEPLEGGFKAVAEQLERIVTGLGLVKFGAVGDAFDPTIHEALSHIGTDPEVEVTTCKVVAKAGYKIGDRVVRAAQVLVVDPAAKWPHARDDEDEPGRRAKTDGGRCAMSDTRRRRGSASDWATKDFYAVLGVGKTASADEIKKAYRKLARANHPDSHPDDSAKHEKFKQVAEAYDVIGDAEKRKKYDQARQLFASGGFPAGGSGYSGGTINLDDLLRERAAAVAAVSATCSATSSAAVPARAADGSSRGRPAAPTSRRRRPSASPRRSTASRCRCGSPPTRRVPTCSGTGGKPGTSPHRCPTCDGTGFVVASVGGAFSMNETCPACGGRQLVYDDACPTCHGSGRGRSARTIQAKVPAGVKDGQRIRLRGKGAPGERGGPAGDLFVTIKVTPHRVFGRKGEHLTIDVPISFAEAALGAAVKVPTLGGAPVTLKIPPGTPNGRTFRVRGKGAPKADGTHGDLLATVEVQVPAHLTDDAREALEAYAAATAGTKLRAGLFEREELWPTRRQYGAEPPPPRRRSS